MIKTKWLPRLALLIVTIVLCLLGLEIALRVLAPLPDPYAQDKLPRSAINQYIKSEFPRNLRLFTQAEDGLPGVSGINKFSTDNLGFRGDDLVAPKPENEFRIFMVGGSTTECLYLDDSKAITRVLQDELNKRAASRFTVKLYGAGKSGDASDDHVSMIAHRIAQLDPDLIIVYLGVNDLTRSINNYDYLHYAPVAEPAGPMRLIKYLGTESQIGRRVYYLFNLLSPSVAQSFQEIHLQSQYRESVRLCNSLPLIDEKPRVDLQSFRNNLKTIIGITQAHKVRLLLMTQQTTWNGPDDPQRKAWQWLLCRSGARYREDLMDDAMNTLNGETRSVAAEFSIPILDLAKVMPKSRLYFYDDVHFNDRGASEAAQELATLIIASNSLQRAAR